MNMNFLKWALCIGIFIVIFYIGTYIYYRHLVEREEKFIKTCSVKDLIETVENGDVILFCSRRLSYWKPLATVWTKTPFLHAAIVEKSQGESPKLYHFGSVSYGCGVEPKWPKRSKCLFYSDLEEFMVEHKKENDSFIKLFRAPKNRWDITSAAENLVDYEYCNKWTKLVFRGYSREQSDEKGIMNCCSFIGQILEELGLIDTDKVKHPFSNYSPQNIPKMLKELDYTTEENFDIKIR